ncbi:MAG: YdjY domain-containing protein [Planctomycetaceae bacterium]|jgi:hypothetical protein|nr:YdjY domain-containing protein [Planctomycetaceae bacterium]
MTKISKKNIGSSCIIVLCVIICLISFLAIFLLVFGTRESKTIVIRSNNSKPAQIEPPANENNQPENNLIDKKIENNSTQTESNLPDKKDVGGTDKKAGSASSLDSDSNVGSKPEDDLADAEIREIYERQLHAESAKLRKLVEEEERFIPLVDNADKLIQLHPKDRIWLEREVGAVVITGRVVLREGMLELFACKTNSKEHESIVSIRVTPELIHAALLAVGAENGKPVQVKPKFVAPSGDEIEIRVKWRAQDGQIKESSAQDWVWDNANSNENNKKPMKTHWVFTGSLRYKDEEGNDHYVANETGELFGLSNFVGSILDVPMQSSADNDKLLFSCFTEKIPPIGTMVTIILTPRKNK